MRAALALIPVPTSLLALDGVGHSLLPAGRRTASVPAVHEAVAAAFVEFVAAPARPA